MPPHANDRSDPAPQPCLTSLSSPCCAPWKQDLYKIEMEWSDFTKNVNSPRGKNSSLRSAILLAFIRDLCFSGRRLLTSFATMQIFINEPQELKMPTVVCRNSSMVYQPFKGQSQNYIQGEPSLYELYTDRTLRRRDFKKKLSYFGKQDENKQCSKELLTLV